MLYYIIFKVVFFPPTVQYLWCPRSWTFLLLGGFCTQPNTRFYGFCCENKVWPWVLMTCLTNRESNPQPWSPIHQLYVSTGTRFRMVSYDFGTKFLYNIYSETRVCPNFCPLRDSFIVFQDNVLGSGTPRSLQPARSNLKVMI